MASLPDSKKAGQMRKRADQLRVGDVIQLLNEETGLVLKAGPSTQDPWEFEVTLHEMPPLFCNAGYIFDLVNPLQEYADWLLLKD